MDMKSEILGGRLPLLDPHELTAAQKMLYGRLNTTMIPWAEGAHFQSKTEDGRLIGPFNPLLYSPDIATRFMDLHDGEEKYTSLNERVRQIVILAVGAAWKCEYELYAHRAAALKAGISEAAIRTLATGGLSGELNEDEKIAYRYAQRLTADHRVDTVLYGDAEQAFGKQGVVDITYLAGIYHIVCSLLNGFEVPAPDRVPKAARLTRIASFPAGYFLENLVIREDNSILVTVLNHRELWYIPPTSGATGPVDPLLVCTFDQLAMGIVEAEKNVFYICTSNLYTSHESYLHRLDLRNWTPGKSVRPELILEFPRTARALNGCCLIAPNILLVADCFAALIWRVDLAVDGGKASAKVWLRHPSMAYDPSGPMPDQPGVNGVRYDARTKYLYYTSTAQQLFVRVPIDPTTFDPAGEPEFVAGGMMADDFCIDEKTGVAYVTTHRQNTIDLVWLEPGGNSNTRHSVAGNPFDEQLIGPSSGAWGRGDGEFGRVAYFTTDGGTKAMKANQPVRPAAVVRIEF